MQRVSDGTESSPSPRTRPVQELSHNLNQQLGLSSSPHIVTLTDSEEGSEEEEDVKMYDGFDIQGVSKEELAFWSRLAPVDQRLRDDDVSFQEPQPSAKKAPRASSLGFIHMPC